jgi:transposase
METANILAEIARLRAEKQALSTQIKEAKNKLEQAEAARQEDHLKIALLEHENGELKRLLYGQKRERFVADLNPAQLTLALGLDQDEAERQPEEEQISYTRKKPQKRKTKPRGRQPWPVHLKRREITLLPDCDLEGMNKIGEHRTEELDYIPARPFVRVFVRPIYADPTPDPDTQKTRVVCAELPPRIIAKSSIGPGMLAAIVCDKFLDHLPIDRQLKRYQRLGVRIAPSTIGNSLRLLAEQIFPLAMALKQAVFQASYLQGDETRIQVLEPTHNLPKAQKKKPPGKTHRGYFWSYYDPPGKLCWFEYCPGRGKQYPRQALKDFEGKLQTDGYGAYDQFAHSRTILLIGCLAHVRRKFFEARTHDPSRADKALDFIKQLYAIEHKAREEKLNFDQRLALRQEEALPIWEKFSTWLEEQLPQVLPQSAIGKAIAYAINRKPYIGRYLQDGILEIDNNLVENQIRPIALGRKNFLFAGSEKGAERAAMFYSLLASCKQNNRDPFTWLHDVLLTLPNHPISQIDQLLPHKWKPNPNIPPALRTGPDL